MYRMKLAAGIVFYGRNAGKKLDTVVLPVRRKREGAWTDIYLHCYKRFFGIWARNRRGLYSDLLTAGQVEQLSQAFDGNEVPYERELLDFAACGTDFPTVEDPVPANSRVVFEVAGVEYHVLNYNACLIKARMADGIAKAFRDKGIPARVEQAGKYAGVERVSLDVASREPERKAPAVDRHPEGVDQGIKSLAPPKGTVVARPQVPVPVPEKYKQVTLFEYMRSMAG